MNIKLEDGELRLNLHELVEALTPEQASEFAQCLVLRRDVLKAVAEILVSGRTEKGYWPSEVELSEARMLVLERLNDLNLGVLKKAIREAGHARKNEDEYRAWAFRLYHGWPVEHIQRRPDLPRTTAEEDMVQLGRIREQAEAEAERRLE